jgi:general secretion pathway protein A
MYTKNFNLNKLPFENVPDPTFFFDQGDYGQIRNQIKNSLIAGRGLIVVTGPIGSGKTTLSQMIKSDYSDNLQLIWMAEPPDNSIDLFLFIIQELGLKNSSAERIFILKDIRQALLKMNSSGKKCLMMIDESHLATKGLLEGIRILNNLEEGPTKLIQILLLGQMEILETLKKPEMKPFKQRIASIEIISKLNADKIRRYISHRIKMAGGQSSIFTETGWEAVVIASGTGGGIPRVINSLCDESLNVAFKKGKSAVDIDDIFEAAAKMGIAEEIFHYRRAIKNKGKKPEATQIEEKPITPLLPHAPITAAEKPDKSKQRITQTANLANLKAPLRLVLLSLLTLILSILFYYQRL